MIKVLITGATGNVGKEVIRSLILTNQPIKIYAGMRDLNENCEAFNAEIIEKISFDFTNLETVEEALKKCDILFLLRPPQISDVKKYFKPLIQQAIICNVKHIVFLSVQGVEKSTIIPHHKIEKLIVESKIPYTFLRPAYFMQNFTTTLRTDLIEKKSIYLPAGNAKFTLIDVRDIGAVSAQVILNIKKYGFKSYELTCNEKLTFQQMSAILSQQLNEKISFNSPNLIQFFISKWKEKTPVMLIFVMIMLHYFPRFQKSPNITSCVVEISGKKPISFQQFVLDNKRLLSN